MLTPLIRHLMRAVAVTIALVSVSIECGAATPYLVKDINRNMNTAPSSNPGYFATIGSTCYFTADNGTIGTELYKTDGTDAGTVLVRDISAGSGGSNPSNLVGANGKLYFFVLNQLWRSDGTAGGTVFVKDWDSAPSAMIVSSDWLYFVAHDANGWEPWESSGSGAWIFRDINSGSANSSPQNLADANGAFYCSAYTSEFGREPYNEGYLLKDINEGTGSSNPGNFTYCNSKIYFSATNASGLGLWNTYGSSYSTNIVKSGFAQIGEFVPFAGKLFFTARASSSGEVELWSSDGTDAGTAVVKDIEPGLSSSPTAKFAIGSVMYFVSYNTTNGVRLWKTDGTAAGTVAVATLCGYSAAETVSFSPRVIGGKLVLFCNTSAHGRDVWVSDGTAAGTTKIFSSTSDFSGVGWVMPNGLLCFTGADAAHGKEPWVTDGTAAGTHLLKELAQTPIEYEYNLIPASGRVYFNFSDSGHGEELWSSDASDAGSCVVKDINPGPASSAPRGMTAFMNRMFFSADNGENGRELWCTDGTAGGTSMFIEMAPSSTGGVGDWCFAAGNKLYFQGIDEEGHMTLCCTGGVVPGQVNTLAPVQVYSSSDPKAKAMCDWNGKFYFNADDGIHGYELWVSDGTPAGTHMVKDLTEGLAYYVSLNMTPAGDRMYYSFNTNYLAVTDGTSDGTRMIHQFIPKATAHVGSPIMQIVGLNHSALIRFRNWYNWSEWDDLWRTDGTSETTKYLNMMADAYDTPELSQPFFGKIYMSLDLYWTDTELGRSDGVCTATLFKEISTGYPRENWGSNPCNFSIYDGRLYFSADDYTHGIELWSTDGTPGGTAMVYEIIPGDWNGDSMPRGITGAGRNVFFLASESHGTEIWALPLDSRSAETISVASGASGPLSSSAAWMSAEFQTNSNAGSLTMARYASTPPGRNGDLSGYWLVSGLQDSSYEVVLTFNYDPAAVAAAGLSESNLRLIRSLDGGRTWSEVASVVDAGANTIRTATAQTALGMYAICAADRVPGMEIWVNFYWNNFEAGTAFDPFNTLLEGVAAVGNGGKVKINAGMTAEHARITKPMRIESVGGTARIGAN